MRNRSLYIMETTERKWGNLHDTAHFFTPNKEGMRQAMLTFLEPGRPSEMSYEQIAQVFTDRLIRLVKRWMLTNDTKKLREAVYAIIEVRSECDRRRHELEESQVTFVERMRVIQWMIMEEETPCKPSRMFPGSNRFRRHFGTLGFWCMRIAYFGRDAFRTKWEKNKSVF
jgi:hypothetical protein